MDAAVSAARAKTESLEVLEAASVSSSLVAQTPMSWQAMVATGVMVARGLQDPPKGTMAGMEAEVATVGSLRSSWRAVKALLSVGMVVMVGMEGTGATVPTLAHQISTTVAMVVMGVTAEVAAEPALMSSQGTIQGVPSPSVGSAEPQEPGAPAATRRVGAAVVVHPVDLDSQTHPTASYPNTVSMGHTWNAALE